MRWLARRSLFAMAAREPPFGALAAGVPLVLIPLFADQRPNAALLAGTGAALVSDLDSGAGVLRAAIETALENPAYRHRSEQIRDEMHAAPGPLDALLRAMH
jgi:UDP:flavonoid glycosyltransferase YjiC (YdhE family)